MLKKERIDIACIQETHNERQDTQEMNEYIIFFGGNELHNEKNNNPTDSERAGVAIAIKRTMLPFVKWIYRISGRIMEIRLKTGNSIKIYQY